jgi:hypothetical protein
MAVKKSKRGVRRVPVPADPVEDDAWERAEAEREVVSEVEAELRELAPGLTDRDLVRLGRQRLDAAWPGWRGLVLEFHRGGRVTRRVEISPTGRAL